jgi:hypothetical protein
VSGDGTPALAAISRWTSVALRWPARRVGRCGQDRRGRSGRGRTLARPGGIAAGDRAAAPFHPCRCGQVGRRAQLPRRSGLASPTHVAGPRCPPVAGASRGCRRPGDVLSWRRAAVLRSPVQLGRSSHRTQGAVQDLPSARGYRLAGGKMAHEPAASGERCCGPRVPSDPTVLAWLLWRGRMSIGPRWPLRRAVGAEELAVGVQRGCGMLQHQCGGGFLGRLPHPLQGVAQRRPATQEQISANTRWGSATLVIGVRSTVSRFVLVDVA